MTNARGGLLFDLDGTLIDTAPDMGGALNLLLQQEAKPSLSAQTIRPHVSHGSRALVRLGFGAHLSATEEQLLIRRYLACYATCLANQSKLFAGMDYLLQQLEKKGTPWGIITNKPIRYTTPLLDALQLRSRCSSLVCGDSMAQRKPHPEPLFLACGQAQLNPSECVYVGDAERDILAGKAANMRTVVMEWGYFDTNEDTHVWGADWHCNSADSLWQICKRVGLV